MVQPAPGISVQHAPLTAEGALVAAGYAGVIIYNGRSGWLGVAPDRGAACTRVSWSCNYVKVCV